MSACHHRNAALLHFIKSAWPAIECLPHDSRMDALMGMAEACGNRLPEMKQAALNAAAALREANQSQLLLRSLLK